MAKNDWDSQIFTRSSRPDRFRIFLSASRRSVLVPPLLPGPAYNECPNTTAHRAHYNAVYMGKHGCRRASARARAVLLGRSRRRWRGTGNRERERDLRQRGLNRKRTGGAILGVRCLSRSNVQQLHAHYTIRRHCEPAFFGNSCATPDSDTALLSTLLHGTSDDGASCAATIRRDLDTICLVRCGCGSPKPRCWSMCLGRSTCGRRRNPKRQRQLYLRLVRTR